MLASRKVKDVGIVVAIVFLGVFSFGLGRLSGLSTYSVPVALCETVPSIPSTTMTAGAGHAAESNIGSTEPYIGTPTYVASKSGSVYHFPWCSGAQRIKEENKIWFSSKEEAQSAGYRPATNCKGL